MSELEELLRQKKLIEQKIKDFKAKHLVTSDYCRFEKKDPDKFDYPWQVSALMTQKHIEYESRSEAAAHGRKEWDRKVTAEYDMNVWKVFIRERTKEEALMKIDRIINSLDLIRKHANEEE